MKRVLINATQPDELRVAIMDDSKLINLDIEISGQEQKKSNIYKGVISSIEPSLGAVFIDYGSERHGFLPLKEISREYFLQEIQQDFNFTNINQVLKVGQELVVQVDKEERGTKGAALTTFISLAGSFLVLMPNNPRAGGISRQIEGEERDQLREIISKLELPEGMGLIVRTAGLGRPREELDWDLKILLRYWEAIKQAAVAKSGPYLIHQESDVIIRAIRDYLRQDIEEILIDDEQACNNARHYISQVRPHLVERLKFYRDYLPLFSRFQIEQQIENAHQREIYLPSGGSLIIDQTEALVAIDINSARATRGTSIEETAFSTNLEAAEEIARQLRIRDIGGLIVIDFIDMTPIRNQRDVEGCLREALKQDRARIQIGRISRFGLLEMSRQRLRSSLTRSTQVPCPRCNGEGTIRSIESLGLSIVHVIQEQASKAKNIHFQLQAPVDVTTYLINEKREVLRNIEKHYPVKITVIPNQYMETPTYQLKQIKIDPSNLNHAKGMPSYKLAKIYKTEVPQRQEIKPFTEPVIQRFLTTTGTTSTSIITPPRKSGSTGLFKRLMTKMFGSDEPPKPPASKTTEHIPQQQSYQSSSDNKRRQPTGTGNHQSPRRRPSREGRRWHSRRAPRGGQRDCGRGGDASFDYYVPSSHTFCRVMSIEMANINKLPVPMTLASSVDFYSKAENCLRHNDLGTDSNSKNIDEGNDVNNLIWKISK
ncbi:Rne/Rng family ribonuclease [Coxiella endosymbiont of Amblyomma nuttalli]|uniref:Rne/Rng family ribonuclease n=1 Tax=Coxiella endosymbiont of Amblyomma nuttalli TaxID=2749996 RepID=UPI001BA48C1B|nr:Ribonuclease E [Coxiella endosymbiont of Amblyomma nuttalli]